MEIKNNEVLTTLEWFYFGDADYDSALILNEAYRKHNPIICFHCQQSVEKYLKAFLCYNKIIFPKIHILETLCAMCSEINPIFNDIAKDCAYLSPFAVQARYPLEMEITDANRTKSLELAKKLMDFQPLADLKKKLISENQQPETDKPEQAEQGETTETNS